MTEEIKRSPNYKFREDELLSEFQRYIDKTYGAHYAKGDEDLQTFELICASKKYFRGLGFAVGNILKYGDRYGEKNGFNRDDLLKVAHYAILALYAHDKYQPDNDK